MSVVARGLAASLMLAAAVPALAASPATRAFLANVVPNVDFLDRSSRFALTNSKSRKLRDFAHSEAAEQTLAANALYDWTQADANPMIASTEAAKLDPTPTGTTKPAATPVWPPTIAPGTATDARLPRGQEDLDSLEGLQGADFDAEYKDKQTDALAQIATDYADYAAKGDAPGLVALAKHELPKVKKRIEALGKL